MKLALDTNRYTDMQQGAPDAVEVLESAAEIILPFVVLAELRAGFSLGHRGRENERALHVFLAKPIVSVAYADEETIGHYATLYQQLRGQGTMIPQNDLWLAALVVQHKLVLYS